MRTRARLVRFGLDKGSVRLKNSGFSQCIIKTSKTLKTSITFCRQRARRTLLLQSYQYSNLLRDPKFQQPSHCSTIECNREYFIEGEWYLKDNGKGKFKETFV